MTHMPDGAAESLSQQPDIPQAIRAYLPIAYREAQYLSDVVRDESIFPLGDALRYAEYYKNVAEKGKSLVRSLIPDLYVDISDKTTFNPKKEQRSDGVALQEFADITEDYGIVYKLGNAPTAGKEWEDQVSFYGRFPDILLKRGPRDLIAFVHEYSHLIFDHHLIKPKNQEVKQAFSQKYYFIDGKYNPKAKSPSDLEMMERSINEGFALTLEELAITKLREDYASYGLSEADLPELDKLIDLRKKAFLENKYRASSAVPEQQAAGKRAMVYNEGYDIVQHIYQKKGIDGLYEIVRSLDPLKISLMERGDQEYQQVLANPELLLTSFRQAR